MVSETGPGMDMSKPPKMRKKGQKDMPSLELRVGQEGGDMSCGTGKLIKALVRHYSGYRCKSFLFWRSVGWSEDVVRESDACSDKQQRGRVVYNRGHVGSLVLALRSRSTRNGRTVTV
jgi:hypothetical protein